MTPEILYRREGSFWKMQACGVSKKGVSETPFAIWLGESWTFSQRITHTPLVMSTHIKQISG